MTATEVLELAIKLSDDILRKISEDRAREIQRLLEIAWASGQQLAIREHWVTSPEFTGWKIDYLMIPPGGHTPGEGPWTLFDPRGRPTSPPERDR